MVVAPGRIPMVRMVRLTPVRLKGLLPYSKPLEAPSVISTDGVFLCRDFAIRQSFGKTALPALNSITNRNINHI